MFQVYKNYYYQDQTAYQEVYPPNTSPTPPTSEHQKFLTDPQSNDDIEQIRFGVNYDITCNIHMTLRTYESSGTRCENEETLWLTQKLPNNRHIDWVFSHNHLKWEYFIEGYGYTNYLFIEVFLGPAQDPYMSLVHRTHDSDTLWIYDCNYDRKLERQEIITDLAPELKDILLIANQILKRNEEVNINSSTHSQDIYNQIQSSILDLDSLIIKTGQFQLPKHPIFSVIHKMQAEVHQTPDMFKVKKLWEK